MSKKKPEAAPVGRPSLYRPEYCEMLIRHMEEGLSFQSFAGVVGVSYDTLYEWVKVHPEFSETMRMAKPKQLLWDEKLLNKGALGTQRGYNAAAHKWKMANAHKWTDRVETTEKSVKGMTEEELIQEARSLLEKHEHKEEQ